MNLMVSILGAGESGVGAALLAKAKGYQVFLSDFGKITEEYRQKLNLHEINFEEGRHTLEVLSKAELVIKSPGIPSEIAIVKSLREAGIPVISEIEFASRFTDAKIVAITGTNGKTTTTLLTHHLLKNAGLNAGIGGNIGKSFAEMVIDDQFDHYVLEISSFQLDDIDTFSPYISMVLNVTPDHLDRYDYDFDKYLKTKLSISKNQVQGDAFIFNIDDASLRKGVKELSNGAELLGISLTDSQVKGAYVQEGYFHLNDGSKSKISIKVLPLFGKHNQSNALAAISAAVKLGIDKEAIESGLRSFKNNPHRMELVDVINGISYINDSKATNVDAVFYALEGVKGKIVWIVGGVDKGNDYTQISSLVDEKVEYMVCLGKTNLQLIETFSGKVKGISEVARMDEAIQIAAKEASEGNTVLLSPACASFDLFKNYEDRGDQFRNEVLKLKREEIK